MEDENTLKSASFAPFFLLALGIFAVLLVLNSEHCSM